MSDPAPEQDSLDSIFQSIDNKLKLNLAETITEEEIERCYQYYLKEKIRFNQDQSQFIKPGKRPSSSSKAEMIERLKNTELDF